MKSKEALNLIKEATQMLYIWVTASRISEYRPEEERKTFIINCLSSGNEEFVKAQSNIESVCSFIINNSIQDEVKQTLFERLKSIYVLASYVVDLWQYYVDMKCPLAYDSTIRSYPSSRAMMDCIKEVADIFGFEIDKHHWPLPKTTGIDNQENQSDNVPQSTGGCNDIKLPANSTESQQKDIEEAKEHFREIYGHYIQDLEGFFKDLEKWAPGDFYNYIQDHIRGHFVMKTFFNDCMNVVPWRKGDDGLNYENVRKWHKPNV